MATNGVDYDNPHRTGEFSDPLGEDSEDTRTVYQRVRAGEKIIQIIPAAEGWRAVMQKGGTFDAPTYEQYPIVCWGLLESGAVAGLISDDAFSSPYEVNIALKFAECYAEFVGYFEPGQTDFEHAHDRRVAT